MLNQHRMLLHNNIIILQMQGLVQVMNIQVRDTETLPFIIHNNIHLNKGRFPILQGMHRSGLIQLHLQQALHQDLDIVHIVRNRLHHHTAVRRLAQIQHRPRLTRHLHKLILLHPVQDVVKHQVQVLVQVQAHQVVVQ